MHRVRSAQSQSYRSSEQEHLISFREDLDRATIAFVIAGTDQASLVEADELIPVFAALLNILCEAFSRDD